jgi:hypothetical protein
MIIKIAILALNASILAPVESLGLRNVVGDKSSSNNDGEESEETSPSIINKKPLDVTSLGLRSLVSGKKSSSDNGEEESEETPLSVINNKPDHGQRDLQQIWCDPTSAAATPSWHPDYSRSWATSGCVLKSDCNQVGKATEAECCAAYYGGQRGGACVIAAGGPTVTQWYADYDTAWATAGCKSDFPYPIYATTFYDTQLACCKAAYAGQTSGACIGELPSPPTTSPTSVGDLGKGWYADYGTSWNIAGCKNTLPRPIYVIVTYDTELQCCKAAYGGQSTDGCVQGLPNPPTKSPTVPPTPKPSTGNPSPLCGVVDYPAAAENINVHIRDDADSFSDIAVTLPLGAHITNMRVTLQITHEWIGDVVINLKAPNGKVLNLFNRQGCDEYDSGSNLVNTIVSSTGTIPFPPQDDCSPPYEPPYTGTFTATATIGVGPTSTPSNAATFADLYSLTNGFWTLAMRDDLTLCEGVLSGWKISFDFCA